MKSLEIVQPLYYLEKKKKTSRRMQREGHVKGQRSENHRKEARIFITSYLNDQLPVDSSVTCTKEF